MLLLFFFGQQGAEGGETTYSPARDRKRRMIAIIEGN
jgi:hypothetical protein